jgi:hypothetical protein
MGAMMSIRGDKRKKRHKRRLFARSSPKHPNHPRKLSESETAALYDHLEISPAEQLGRDSIKAHLEGMNRDEVREQAKQYNIAGRGKMTKAELIDAIVEEVHRVPESAVSNVQA